MIPRINWKSWFGFVAECSKSDKRRLLARPQVEALEDRTTPAMLDLTTHGAIGTVGDGVFRQFDAQPTGSGLIDSFVRIQSIKGAVQQGFNSDYRKVQFDENTSPHFDRSLLLSEVPTVDIGGITYREFLLDINQKASQPLLSLDELRIFMGNAPDLTGYDPSTQQLAGLNAVYDLGAGNWIQLDASLNQGSGKGDMLAYIPDSLFTGGSYVYLYSKFGVNDTANAGFEEWAAGKDTLTAATGSISGFVYSQVTVNNVTIITPVANEIVFIDTNGDGVLDDNEVFTTTNTNGYYEFDFLATGLGAYSTYTVRIIPTDNVTETVGGTPESYPYDVSLQAAGQNVTDVDFYLASIRQPPPNA